MKWEKAQDIQKELEEIVDSVEDFTHIRTKRVFCYRSYEAKTRAYARIWSFPKIFQEALSVEAAYILELVSEKYKRLDPARQKKVLIHELLHIPKNFSGSLLPHKYGHKTIDREVERIFKAVKHIL